MTEEITPRKPGWGKNILILSAASKVRLVERFKEAGQRFGAQVYVSDLEHRFAAQFFADGTILLPSSNDASFASVLLEKVRAHDIGLIIPTRDGELLQMAELQDDLYNVRAMALVSSTQAVQICQDKDRFLDAVQALGLNGTPRLKQETITAQDFPLFARPRSGAGGIGAQRINTEEELRRAALDPQETLLHPFIDLPEYSVDCLFDLNGKPLQAIARQREHVVAGESKRSTTVDAGMVSDACLRLGAHLGLRGHVLFQVFWDGISEPVFIEVNPRFGGASDLSIEAGIQSPERILTFLHGSAQEVEQAYMPRQLRYGLTMFRYARDVFWERASDE